MFDDNNYEDDLEMEDCEISDLQIKVSNLEEENQNLKIAVAKYLHERNGTIDELCDSDRLLLQVSQCRPVIPDRRMSYVEIQMDWELYDQIQKLFP